MLYAVVFAAGISLLVSLLVFPASSSKLLAQQVIDTLGITSELLLTTLHLFQADARSVHTIKEYRSLCEQVLHLRQDLGSAVAKLRPAYEDARYELTYALFPLEQYEAFINLSLKLQTILVSRMGLKVNGHACSSEFAAAAIPEFELTQEDHDKPAYLRTLVDELGRMNLTALNTIRCAVARSSFLPDSAETVSSDTEGGQTSGIQGLKDVFREKELHKLRERLDDIVETFRSGIVGALDMAVQQHGSAEDGSQRLFRSNVSARHVYARRSTADCHVNRPFGIASSLLHWWS